MAQIKISYAVHSTWEKNIEDSTLGKLYIPNIQETRGACLLKLVGKESVCYEKAMTIKELVGGVFYLIGYAFRAIYSTQKRLQVQELAFEIWTRKWIVTISHSSDRDNKKALNIGLDGEESLPTAPPVAAALTAAAVVGENISNGLIKKSSNQPIIESLKDTLDDDSDSEVEEDALVRLKSFKALLHGAEQVVTDQMEKGNFEIPISLALLISKEGDNASMCEFLEKFPSLNNEANRTLFFCIAASKGNQDVMESLFAKGVSINGFFEDATTQKTALILAVDNFQLKAVYWLLQRGAFVRIADPKTGKTALDGLIAKNYSADLEILARLLLAGDEGKEPEKLLEGLIATLEAENSSHPWLPFLKAEKKLIESIRIGKNCESATELAAGIFVHSISNPRDTDFGEAAEVYKHAKFISGSGTAGGLILRYSSKGLESVART